MFYFIISIVVLANLCVSGYLYTQVNKKHEDIRKEIATSNNIFPMPPRNPLFEDVDPDYQTLKDVIKSINMENWEVKIVYDNRIECYNINFTNPSKTLILKIRLRIKNTIYPDTIDLSLLNLTISTSDGDNRSIRFDTENKVVVCSVISFTWDYVLKFHEEQNDATTKSLLNLKDAVNEQLKTLKRDNKINSLF